MNPDKKIAQNNLNGAGKKAGRTIGDRRNRRNNKRGARAKADRWLRANS